MASGDIRSRPNHGLSPLDRALSVATEVKAGEAATALLLALNVCLLLSAYYVIKPVREALILSTGGAEVKSYASVGQAAILTLAVPAYGYLVGKVRREVLIPAVTFFFMGCLALFYFAALAQLPFIGVAFYLFVGVFNLMVVAQFWSFANDIYTQEQGERLFPVVAFGASVGAVIGSSITSFLVKSLGVEQMLLVSAVILGATVLVTKLVESREHHIIDAKPEEPAVAHVAAREEDKDSGASPFSLVLRNPYLLLIAGLMFLANLVNTTGEYILGSVVADYATALVENGEAGGLSVADTIGAFYGDFFFWVNILGVSVQLLLVSRIIKWVGVRGAILALPIIALASYLTLALFPILAVVRWVKTAENATDYSLNNTVRNALFLPLSREEKYKAKQAIDTFFVRGGDVASAGVVFVGVNVLSWSEVGFAWFNAVIVAGWLVIALAIGRRYAKLSATAPPAGAASTADE